MEHPVMRPLVGVGCCGKCLVQGGFHGVERYRLARPHGHADEFAGSVSFRVFSKYYMAAIRKIQAGEAHFVLCDGSGFIGTDDRSAAEGFHRSHLFDDDAGFHQPPGAERHESCECDGNFFRQDTHCQSERFEQTVKHIAALRVIDAPY